MFDFIVGGCQKGATTWLYLCLRDHPEVLVPAKKMEWEYLGGDWVAEQGQEAYAEMLGFGARPGIRGQVSVQYLADDRSAEALHAASPGCKIIFVLREPIERLVSAYHWYWRQGGMPFSLNEAVSQALGIQVGGWEDLVDRGCYAQQLDPYLEKFPAEQILLLSYDAICRDPAGVWAQVQAFIGCENPRNVLHTHSLPKQNSYVSWITGLERRAPKSRVMLHLANGLHQLCSRLGIKGKPGQLAPERQGMLKEIFRKDLEKLLDGRLDGVAGAAFLLRDVKAWLNGYTD